MAIAASMPMITMTMSNSMRVKPPSPLRFFSRVFWNILFPSMGVCVRIVPASWVPRSIPAGDPQSIHNPVFVRPERPIHGPFGQRNRDGRLTWSSRGVRDLEQYGQSVDRRPVLVRQ